VIWDGENMRQREHGMTGAWDDGMAGIMSGSGMGQVGSGMCIILEHFNREVIWLQWTVRCDWLSTYSQVENPKVGERQ